CRLRTNFVEYLVRTQLFHGERQRKHLGNRLDRKRVVHIAQSEHLVVGRNNGYPEQLWIHLRKIGNIVRVLPVRVAFELFVSLPNHRLHKFAPWSYRTAGLLRLHPTRHTDHTENCEREDCPDPRAFHSWLAFSGSTSIFEALAPVVLEAELQPV